MVHFLGPPMWWGNGLVKNLGVRPKVSSSLYGSKRRGHSSSVVERIINLEADVGRRTSIVISFFHFVYADWVSPFKIKRINLHEHIFSEMATNLAIPNQAYRGKIKPRKFSKLHVSAT